MNGKPAGKVALVVAVAVAVASFGADPSADSPSANDDEEVEVEDEETPAASECILTSLTLTAGGLPIGGSGLILTEAGESANELCGRVAAASNLSLTAAGSSEDVDVMTDDDRLLQGYTNTNARRPPL